jgi:hypothetical protein
VLGEIEMETKLKMKIIPRSTSEAQKFFRQVRFLTDFDPDRADIRSVRRKVSENHRNFTIERPLNIGDFLCYQYSYPGLDFDYLCVLSLNFKFTGHVLVEWMAP